eukprot:4535363-Ditylum_brightwellii.AAC.1
MAKRVCSCATVVYNTPLREFRITLHHFQQVDLLVFPYFLFCTAVAKIRTVDDVIMSFPATCFSSAVPFCVAFASDL